MISSRGVCVKLKMRVVCSGVEHAVHALHTEHRYLMLSPQTVGNQTPTQRTQLGKIYTQRVEVGELDPDFT